MTRRALAEDRDDRFLDRVRDARDGCQGKVEKACLDEEGKRRIFCRQFIDDAPKNQRRRDGNGDGDEDGKDEPDSQLLIMQGSIAENGVKRALRVDGILLVDLSSPPSARACCIFQRRRYSLFLLRSSSWGRTSTLPSPEIQTTRSKSLKKWRRWEMRMTIESFSIGRMLVRISSSVFLSTAEKGSSRMRSGRLW